MTRPPEIDFARIAPRGGSQHGAFEELCCQLARDEVPDPARFRRVRGGGGDGGVECTWTAPSGQVHGWQVKYVFDLSRALRKASESLATARATVPGLARFVLCLPFDLSGSRGRGGTSQQQKYDAFVEAQEARAAAEGQPLTVVLWSAFELRERLIRLDTSGGRARYWFDAGVLDSAWFSRHVDAAVLRAGPRYSPELHTGHALDETLSALGGGPDWSAVVEDRRGRIAALADRWASALSCGRGRGVEPFPEGAEEPGQAVLQGLRAAAGFVQGHAAALDGARAAAQGLERCEQLLADDIDARFGPGRADSVPFRQFQAEYQCRFPAQHLDTCRELEGPAAELVSWLEAPVVRVSDQRMLLLTGPAGIGKTHGLCDAAARRRDQGLLTILLSGAQFGRERSLSESLVGALGLPPTWSMDQVLDALDAAAAGSDRLLLLLDALDERPVRSQWLDDLPVLVDAVARRPHLALCVAVRSGYQDQVVRGDLALPTLTHPGFGEDVFDACSSFFEHFDLDPPIGPLLDPEYGNPLFLLVLCRALKARGLRRVPVGWRGARVVLGQLLAARDHELKRAHPGVGRCAVSDALGAIADSLERDGPIAWSTADAIVTDCLPPSRRTEVALLDHLVGLGLLRVVPGTPDDWGRCEDRVDIAFGRLGHHLVAERLVDGTAPASDERLRERALCDPGLSHALALAMPELGRGELVDLASNPDERRTLLEAWIVSVPWRSAVSLDSGVEALLLEALRDAELSHDALDALLVLAMRPGHAYDHRFLHTFLSGRAMPLRDAGWSWFLHCAFERTSPPSPLVRLLRAPWDAEVTGVPADLREAWCVVLSWSAAAADLRVRDHATKAAVRLTEAAPATWVPLVERFACVDDDTVLERVLCAAYGAALRAPSRDALRALAAVVRDHVLRRPGGPPRHALVRDFARCQGELAAHRDALPDDAVLDDFRPPFDAAVELRIPALADLERFDDPRCRATRKTDPATT